MGVYHSELHMLIYKELCTECSIDGIYIVKNTILS